MTENKPIMIDGVDVSECDKYPLHNKWQGNIILCSGGCEKYPNCYFKQLARKTQECEELKNIINEAKNSGLDLKSFLLGEAIQKEYEEQLAQLKVNKEQAEQKFKKIREYCNKYPQNSIGFKKNILQIIDEVE